MENKEGQFKQGREEEKTFEFQKPKYRYELPGYTEEAEQIIGEMTVIRGRKALTTRSTFIKPRSVKKFKKALYCLHEQGSRPTHAADNIFYRGTAS